MVTIRRRLPADDNAIRRLNDVAFGGTAESKLIAELRREGLAIIELVTEDQEEIVGHILFSKLSVLSDGQPIDVLALAPMAVRPDRQRAGIGSALVHAGLNAACHCKWRAAIVLGHPSYYPRFGFSTERARHLRAPFRGNAFMVLEFVPGALAGAEVSVVYPPAFGIMPPPGPQPSG